MNKADEIKQLVQELTDNALNAGHPASGAGALRGLFKSQTELHAAIDEMQAEIERLREWQENAYIAFGAIAMHVESIKD